jgi:5-methyltetrahydropteroyltriglutamate--homocysteine methyltransferase
VANEVNYMENADRIPFRADHVGSLLRPEPLHDARRQFAAGTLDGAALREQEDREISRIVARQEAVGLQLATDGEFRRASWVTDFVQSVTGVPNRTGGSRAKWFGADGDEIELAPIATVHAPPSTSASALKLKSVVFADDFTYLDEQCKSAVAKLCLPSPSMLHFRGGDAAIDRTIYPDLEEFWSDLVDVYVHEIEGLAAIGCRYLQLDDTTFAFLCDPREQAGLIERGNDAPSLFSRYTDTINRVVARRPAGMSITLHTCRGNNQSAWAASGGYEPIAESVLGGLHVDGLFLEFDDERSGSFDVLRFVPAGTRVVLGLVSSKIPTLEDKSMLKRRVDEASKFLPLEQLCISPQCGFASTEPGNNLTDDEEFAKLELVVETAAEIWG